MAKLILYGTICAALCAMIVSACSAGESMTKDLVEASRIGDLKEVKRLIKDGADQDAEHGREGGTALTSATATGQLQVIQFLIANGANVNKAAGSGTPLCTAATAGQPEAAKLLLAAGAKLGVNRNGARFLRRMLQENKWIALEKLLDEQLKALE